MQTEIKNALKTSFGRVPKFNLGIYAFAYDCLIYFPKSDIQYETFYYKLIFCKRTSFNKNESSYASFSCNSQDNWLRA